MDAVIDFINLQRDRYIDELKSYLAIPSVSVLRQRTHARDCEVAFQHVDVSIALEIDELDDSDHGTITELEG
jgi:hypothetical protein